MNNIQAVKDYAQEHYEDGWDVVVEAMEDKEIAHIIKGAGSHRIAIYLMSVFVKNHKEYGDDIRGA
jgi:mannitol-1-phosphate/altronate dehydrogenase